jgi:hypothetical protein
VLTGQLVEIRATMTTLEIFQRGERVAFAKEQSKTYVVSICCAGAFKTAQSVRHSAMRGCGWM